MLKAKKLVLFIFVIILLVLAPACSSQEAPEEIVIGASIPISGVLSAFGSYEEWGYQTAVDEINEEGGIFLEEFDARVPVRLVLYDDESSPEKVAENTERLILQDEVDALLGSATPPLVISGAVIAERENVPMVTGIAPIRAFLGANEEGWNWVWDIFFDELEMTEQQFLTMDQVESNRKVALFTDNEQDGIVMGGLWEEKAPQFGYEIVYHADFPVGTTEYGDLIRRAQEAEAEIIIAQMITPDALALWNQMQALDYQPKAAFFEKGGEPVAWWEVLGDTAQGTMVAGYWHPNLDYPGAQELRDRFEADTGQLYSQHIADTYTSAQVLIDAIGRAGSLDKEAINSAIGETDETYVVGPVKFTEGVNQRASALPIFMLQWQDGDLEIVYPPELSTSEFIYPIP
ncbi:MAG: amino acid ABC transporter substrate-binding protein [Chloroflexota bacterium]